MTSYCWTHADTTPPQSVDYDHYPDMSKEDRESAIDSCKKNPGMRYDEATSTCHIDCRPVPPLCIKRTKDSLVSLGSMKEDLPQECWDAAVQKKWCPKGH